MPGFGLGGLGAAGTGLAGGYNQEYDAITQQMAQGAAYRGLQALATMNQQMPQGMPPGGPSPPGAGPMPPPGPPVAGASPGMGPLPPQAPQMPQGQPPMGGLPPGGQMQPGMGSPMGGPMGGPPGTGMYTLPMIMQAVQRSNPGAPPNVLMAAVAKMVPLMRPSDQEYFKMIAAQQAQQRLGQGEVRLGQNQERIEQAGELGKARIGATERGQDMRADTAQRGQDIRADTAAKAETGRQQRFDVNQERMKAATSIRQDQGWQRLEQQRQQAMQRNDVMAARAVLDAQHKRAMEIIGAYSAQSAMPNEVRQQLLKDSNDAYESAIKSMRGSGQQQRTFGDRFQGGP